MPGELGGWGWSPGAGFAFPGSDEFAGYLVYDRFTDTNGTALASHTPDKDTEGGGWTDVTAGITIESNKASDNQADRKSVIDAGNANVTIECDLVLAGGSFFGVIFRYKDAANFLIAGCDLIFDDTTVWKCVANVWTKLSNPNHVYADGDSVNIRVILDGTSVKVEIDDVEEISITEASHQTETEHGLYSDGTAWAADGTWENFNISAT